ncbi:MAG: hypothetical protein AB7P31_11150 [Steroidobacteraceae bacterium]
MKAMPILMRREFWEHRALWAAPLAMAVILVLVAIFGRFEMATMTALSTEQARAILGVTVWAMSLVIFLIAGIVLSFYLLDCLYSDRRDRSILFWKSLPVSDAATVLAKFGVAIVVVPLGAFALAIVTDLAVRGILTLRTGAGLMVEHFPLWDGWAWLQTQALLALLLAASLLWYAPLAAYLLVVSAWARRNVMLWAVMPPLVVALVERLALHTSHAWDFISGRLEPAFPAMAGVEAQIRASIVTIHRDHIVSMPRLFEQLDVAPIFFNVQMLLGLVATAALLYGAIRLRRWRDDG